MAGVTWRWLNALFGMAIVVVTFVIFDYVIWGNIVPVTDTITTPVGFNSTDGFGSTTVGYLKNTWLMWAVPFIIGWMLYMILSALIREPTES